MAFKSFIIISTLFVLSQCGPTPPCLCDHDEAELEKLWEFYNSEIKINHDAVIAGEISPLMLCSDCVEYNRRKRKTDTENEEPEAPRKVADVTEKAPRKDADVTEKNPRMITENPETAEYADYYDDTKPGVDDPTCPAGLKRIGRWCA